MIKYQNFNFYEKAYLVNKHEWKNKIDKLTEK